VTGSPNTIPLVTDVAPDGSPVTFYRRLPAAGEPELIHRVISQLVNDPEGGVAFVATAAAHLDPDGVVVGQTYPPDWVPSAAVGHETRMGDARIELLSATVVGDRLEAEVRYGVDGRVWQQSFVARLLGEDGLREVLADGGLAFDHWLERPGWFLAR
jgi:hypothetical protein